MNIVKDDNFFASQILSNYFFYSDNKILNYLDNQNLNDFEKSAKELYKIWFDGIEEITNIYLNVLEESLK